MRRFHRSHGAARRTAHLCALARIPVALFVLPLALAACVPNPPASGSAPVAAGADTVRGTLVVEGSEPMTVAVLRTTAGRVVLDSAPAGISGLSQLELWVRGTALSGGHFKASAFAVRGANGSPAWDGVLASGPAGYALVLSDGARRELRGPPPGFAALVGKRIWVTETVSGTVADYGVI